MGILSRLFKGTTTRPNNPVPTPVVYAGFETLHVVGEASYQTNLWRIVGRPSGERVRVPIRAVLLPEPSNPYDPNAIQVRINGLVVGYLSRDDATRYGPGVARLMYANDNRLIALDGVISGGGSRGDRPSMLGVFLNHDPADFGLSSSRARQASPEVGNRSGFRTGLSDASATDAADDTYDCLGSIRCPRTTSPRSSSYVSTASPTQTQWTATT